MASIFSKPAKEPDYKAALQESENSILKRLNTFIDETTNKWKSTNDWIKKTGDQVNELLKRTFDLQRKVETQLIDVENTAKKQFYSYDEKLSKFESRLNGKYITVKEHNEKIDAVAGLVKDLVTKVDKIPAQIKQVENQIPRNTVTKETVSDVVSELRTSIEKVANAIPTNVAKSDLVADLHRDVLSKFDAYATTDALKATLRDAEVKIEKVAKSAAKVSQENKETKKDFGKVADKVNQISSDYVAKGAIPAIEKKIDKATQELLKSIKGVQSLIPTDFASISEMNVIREFQRDLVSKFEEHKLANGTSMSTTHSNIESIMARTLTKVEDSIEAFKKELAETTMGEDTNFMKTIIRDIADEEVKVLRNSAMLFQENTKGSVTEIKNQNRNMAKKMSELESSFNKLIQLSKAK